MKLNYLLEDQDKSSQIIDVLETVPHLWDCIINAKMPMGYMAGKCVFTLESLLDFIRNNPNISKEDIVNGLFIRMVISNGGKCPNKREFKKLKQIVTPPPPKPTSSFHDEDEFGHEIGTLFEFEFIINSRKGETARRLGRMFAIAHGMESDMNLSTPKLDGWLQGIYTTILNKCLEASYHDIR